MMSYNDTGGKYTKNRTIFLIFCLLSDRLPLILNDLEWFYSCSDAGRWTCAPNGSSISGHCPNAGRPTARKATVVNQIPASGY